MRYAQNTLLNKKLPSYVGFFVLLVALGVTILLSKNTFSFVTKATIGSDPKSIQVSNVSDTAFTVSYTTDASAIGTISYGTDPSTPNIALDDRDQQASKAAEHQVHFITVKNLLPATKYYYVIDSGSQKTEDNGKPFEITTAAPLSTPLTGQPTLAGTVALSDESIPTEGIVSVSADTSQKLAALISPDGSYKIPLNQMRNATFTAPAALTPNTILQIQAATSTQQSLVKVLISQANQVPQIIMQQNYDFTLTAAQSASDSAQQTASISGFPDFSTPAPVSSPEITTPIDAQTFKDQQPTFQGRALPNVEVDVTIQSQQEISTKLQSDDNGAWQFRPPVSLAPGKHIITIKSLDAAGIIQTISKSFTVYAAGSQFVEPSVSPIATALPSPSPTATPTVAPTPTIAPTAIATPSSKPLPAPSHGPVPRTGSTITLVGIITGIAAVGIGTLLFFLSAI